MNSQFVRIILPTNKNIQLLAPLQQSTLQHPQSCISGQIRLINSNASVMIPATASSPLEANVASRLPLSSLNTNQQILQQTCSSIEVAASCQDRLETSSMAETVAFENNSVQSDPVSNIGRFSCCTGQKKFKRSKNWSEEETAIFINIWSDHYTNLMTGGSRNSPIYQSMAQQLKQLLPTRVMTGADVKSKITNLVAEYRKKKKEQGKTGSSPSSWRYFDQIDKLLGERPFNDESLMSDSISLQQEQLLQDIENTSVSDLHLNSFSEDTDDNISSIINEIEESTNDIENRSWTSKSPSNSSSTQKKTSMNTPDVSNKKTFLSKKKKPADMRIDLIQQMINKIDSANEIAARAETKALALLEKQTKLQEESLNNEKEFLNVFRTIARGFNTYP
ncbi:unnamed protein product [Rotaria sordida]|uniref:Myb/SANT-like DNA-binding domain-containing protein n=1 Tax=Rotaria sordida TaxID=392033 RepID=A0A815VR61_9BILA|nr:unnamed protein product [Rotaria sordida]